MATENTVLIFKSAAVYGGPESDGLTDIQIMEGVCVYCSHYILQLKINEELNTRTESDVHRIQG